MLTQDIWKKLTPTLVRPLASQNLFGTRLTWKFLSIAGLENFESVSNQFASLGLHFEDAIAIRPSNPRFLSNGCQMVVMSADQGKTLKVSLDADVAHTHLWLKGSQTVKVSALNAQGHCMAVAETKSARTAKSAPLYAEEGVLIDTRAAKTLRIESKAPFVLTRLAVKHPTDLVDRSSRFLG